MQEMTVDAPLGQPTNARAFVPLTRTDIADLVHGLEAAAVNEATKAAANGDYQRLVGVANTEELRTRLLEANAKIVEAVRDAHPANGNGQRIPDARDQAVLR